MIAEVGARRIAAMTLIFFAQRALAASPISIAAVIPSLNAPFAVNVVVRESALKLLKVGL